MEPYSQSLARVDELEVVLSEAQEGIDVLVENVLFCLNHPNAPEEEHAPRRDIVLLALANLQEKIAEAIAEEE